VILPVSSAQRLVAVHLELAAAGVELAEQALGGAVRLQLLVDGVQPRQREE
jgi:hypothetical protein